MQLFDALTLWPPLMLLLLLLLVLFVLFAAVCLRVAVVVVTATVPVPGAGAVAIDVVAAAQRTGITPAHTVMGHATVSRHGRRGKGVGATRDPSNAAKGHGPADISRSRPMACTSISAIPVKFRPRGVFTQGT